MIFRSAVKPCCSGFSERRHLRRQRLLAMDLDDGLAQRPRLYLARRPNRDDAPLVDDGHAIAQALRLLDVVRGQQNSAVRIFQLLNQLVDLVPHLRVETGRGLIEK